MTDGAVEAFIQRWQGREGGQERANYALFLSELTDVIGAPRPEPPRWTRTAMRSGGRLEPDVAGLANRGVTRHGRELTRPESP